MEQRGRAQAMNRNRRVVAAMLCLTVGLAVSGGCGLLAQKTPAEDNRIVVTMAYSEKMEHVEAFIEEKLPDIDFQWERITSGMNSDIKRRLHAGHGPDLVVSTQPADEDSGQYVLPLGGYAFSTRYENTMIKSLSVNDLIYYLPFPGEYNGYVVNKTLFDEAGFALPDSDEALLEDLIAFRDLSIGLSETGYVFGLRDKNDVVLGDFLVGCMVPDFLGTTVGVHWLADYDQKQAVMSGTWEPAFDLLEGLVEHDLMNITTYSKQGNAPNIAEYMSQGKLVAAYGHSVFLEECRELNQQAVKEGTSRKYEYTMLPFLGTQDAAKWTIAAPSAYIGLNAKLNEAGNEAKLDACCRILDALSTQAGQEALMADSRTDQSYLKGFEKKEQIPSGLEEVVENGYVYNVKFPGKVIEYLGKEGALFLSGEQSVAECLAAVDEYHLTGSKTIEDDLAVVGSVAEDLIYQGYDTRLGETALGNLVADSIAEFAKTPIAVANGGGIRASLYMGDVRAADLKAVCPYDNQIVVVKLSGQVLEEMLENSLSEYKSSGDVPGGRFLQVSGLCYTFDSTQPAGKRLLKVTLANGSAIEKTAVYTVAINNYMAGKNGYLEGNGDGYTMLNLYSEELPLAKDVTLVQENLGTYRDALRFYFEQHANAMIDSEVEGRIINVAQDSQ